MRKDYFCPVDLRVDLQNAEIPVTEEKNPVFSWAAHHNRCGSRQSGYCITVYRENELIWNSGKVESAEQRAVYAGKPLKNGDYLTFGLRLTDEHGNFSEEAKKDFLVSFGAELCADWISAVEYRQNDVMRFMKCFSLNGKVKRGILSVCGLGIHEPYLNGICVDSHLFQPAISNYDKNIYYCAYPLRAECFQEENVLEIVLADGWRNNRGEWSAEMEKNHPVPLFGKPMLFAELVLFYDDGTREYIRTGEDWLAKKTRTESNLFLGETFDESKEETPLTVCREKAPNGSLHPQRFCGEKMCERHTPIAVVRNGNGSYTVDFGVNIAGVCELKIPESVHDGRKIILRHAELIDDNFRIDRENLRSAAATDCYITKKGCERERLWMPHYTYHGFRYAEVLGLERLGFDDITAISVYNDIKNKSYFRCSDALLNTIWDAVVLTEQNNIHGQFTDCPQRDERMGWMNDAAARFESVEYLFDVGGMFRKVIEDCISEQDESGAVTCTAPHFFGCRPADPICSAFITAAYENIMHYADFETAKKYFGCFEAWNERIGEMCENYIVTYTLYGDWASPAENCVSYENPHSAETPDDFISTGFYYQNTMLLKKMAKMLGMKQKAEKYAKLGEEILSAIRKKWIDDENGIAAGGSQGAQTFALSMGFFKEPYRQYAAERLEKTVEGNNYRLATGNITTKKLLEELSEYGYADSAFRIMAETEYPSYGYWFRRGATTLWERFEDKRNSSMNSHNHAMYGAIGSWFFEYLGGIKVIKPGFSAVRIKPCYPEKTDFVEANLDTIKGMIFVRWIRRNGKIYLTVDIPFGVEAEIFADKVYHVTNGVYTYEITEGK